MGSVKETEENLACALLFGRATRDAYSARPKKKGGFSQKIVVPLHPRKGSKRGSKSGSKIGSKLATLVEVKRDVSLNSRLQRYRPAQGA